MKTETNQPKKKNNPLSFKEKLSQWLMVVFLLFLPTQLAKHFFLGFSYLSGVRVDYLAIKIYLTDVIFFFLLCLNLKTVFSFFKKNYWLFFLLFFNFIFALNKQVAFYYSVKVLEWLAVFIIFTKNQLSFKKILLAFAANGFLELTLAIFQLFYQRSLQGVVYFLGERYFTLITPGIAKISFFGKEILRPYASFSHPNSLAGFYLLLYFFVLTNKKINRFFYWRFFILFVSASLIFLSFSKIAIIGFLFLNLIYFLKNNKNCGLCFFSRTTTFFILSLIFLQGKGDPHSFLKRVELFKNSLIIIIQHPLFGVGLGNYLLAQNHFSSPYPLFFNQPVHNIFLLIIAEIGIPMAFFLFYKLFFFLKKRKFTIDYLLLTIIFTGFFDHYWLTLQQNFFLLAIVFGLVLKRD
ncbi:MAG: O-antigen ligase family protein [Patescibacteria group bacterium]|nr:O-antigen ligase family protein [Patescibacteria group bacterium]